MLPGDQYNLYEQGRYNDTPVLIGTNSDEGALFVALLPRRPLTRKAFTPATAITRTKYWPLIPLARIPKRFALPATSPAILLSAGAHGPGRGCNQRAATAKPTFIISAIGRLIPITPQFKSWGAAHGAEISYVFGNFTPSMPPSAEDRAVSDTVSSYWVNFAKTGDPNGQGMPTWPAFSNSKPEVMNLNDPSKAIPFPNVEKLKVLDSYYAWRRSQEAEKLSNNSPKGAN